MTIEATVILSASDIVPSEEEKTGDPSERSRYDGETLSSPAPVGTAPCAKAPAADATALGAMEPSVEERRSAFCPAEA